MKNSSAQPGGALAADAGFPSAEADHVAGGLAGNGRTGYNDREEVLRLMGVEACKLSKSWFGKKMTRGSVISRITPITGPRATAPGSQGAPEGPLCGSVCWVDSRCSASRGPSRVMKRVDLIKTIEEFGCVLIRHGAKHDWYRNPNTGVSQPVPRHRELKFWKHFRQRKQSEHLNPSNRRKQSQQSDGLVTCILRRMIPFCSGD
jgi:hypothetical protein